MTSKISIASIVRSGTSKLSKKQQWPNPELSIGRECASISGLSCWTVTGPALQTFQELSIPIKDFLDRRQEDIERGEKKPQTVSFHMLMVGSEPAKAEPTIIFTSKNQRQRTYTSILIKQEKLLDDYPGVKIKTLPKMPAVRRSGPFLSKSNHKPQSDDGIYLIDRPKSACGALISYGGSKLGTLGGVILIKGVLHGLATQHPRYNIHEKIEKLDTQNDLLSFDEDMTFDNDEVTEITSRESVSSESDLEGSENLSSCSEDESIFDIPYTPPKSISPGPTVEEAASGECSQIIQLGPKISTLSSDCTMNDLDYEVFRIDDPTFPTFNEVNTSAPNMEYPRPIYPKQIARRVTAETAVRVVTGTTGCVKGTILECPYYLKMAGSMKYQETWQVVLERPTVPGDSGSWVVDATTGDLFGYIMAGDPSSCMAFIVPAYKVFDEIEQRFGARPTFPANEALSQPRSTSIPSLERQVEVKRAQTIETALSILNRYRSDNQDFSRKYQVAEQLGPYYSIQRAFDIFMPVVWFGTIESAFAVTKLFLLIVLGFFVSLGLGSWFHPPITSAQSNTFSLSSTSTLDIYSGLSASVGISSTWIIEAALRLYGLSSLLASTFILIAIVQCVYISAVELAAVPGKPFSGLFSTGLLGGFALCSVYQQPTNSGLLSILPLTVYLLNVPHKHTNSRSNGHSETLKYIHNFFGNRFYSTLSYLDSVARTNLMFGRYRIWTTICGSIILRAHLTHFFEAHRIEVSSWHTLIISLIGSLLLVRTQNFVLCCWIPRRTFSKFKIPGLKHGLPSSITPKEYRENAKWYGTVIDALDESSRGSFKFFFRTLRHIWDPSLGLNAVHGDPAYEALETNDYSLIPIQRSSFSAAAAPETRRGRNSDAVVSLFKIAPVAAEHSVVSASNGSLSIAAFRSRKRSQDRRLDPLLYFTKPSPRVLIYDFGGAGKSLLCKSLLYHHQSQLYYQTRLHITRSVGTSWLESDDYNTDSQDQKIRISHMSAISRGDEPPVSSTSQKTDLIIKFPEFRWSPSAMLHEENGTYSIFEDTSSRTLHSFADPKVYDIVDLLIFTEHDCVLGTEEAKSLYGRRCRPQRPSTVSRKYDPIRSLRSTSRRSRFENVIFAKSEIWLKRRLSPLSPKTSDLCHFCTTHTRDPLRRHDLICYYAGHGVNGRHSAADPLLRRLHFLPGPKGARRREIWRDVDIERWRNHGTIHEPLHMPQPPDIPPCSHCLGTYWYWICGLFYRPWRSVMLRFIYLSISLTTICAGLLYVRKLGL